MSDDSGGQRSEIERRTALRVLGSGAALGLVPGLGAARGPPDHAQNENGNGPPQNANGNGGPSAANAPEDCCEEGEFLAKYEAAGDEFRFSEGSDAVSLEVTETKEENEIRGFEWESETTVAKICVKYGPETATFTPDDTEGTVESEELPGGYGVSHVTFCGGEDGEVVYYQIDFVTGEPIRTNCCTMESYGDRLLASAFGNTEDAVTRRVSGSDLSNDYDDCFEVSGGDSEPHDRIGDIEVDGDEATVTFTPENGEDCPEKLSLVTYVVTDPPYSTDDQELFDSTTVRWETLDFDTENELTTTVPN